MKHINTLISFLIFTLGIFANVQAMYVEGQRDVEPLEQQFSGVEITNRDDSTFFSNNHIDSLVQAFHDANDSQTKYDLAAQLCQTDRQGAGVVFDYALSMAEQDASLAVLFYEVIIAHYSKDEFPEAYLNAGVLCANLNKSRAILDKVFRYCDGILDRPQFSWPDETYLNLADVYFDDNKFDKAAELYEHVIQRNQESKLSGYQYAQAAYAHSENENKQRAVELFDVALTRNFIEEVIEIDAIYLVKNALFDYYHFKNYEKVAELSAYLLKRTDRCEYVDLAVLSPHIIESHMKLSDFSNAVLCAEKLLPIIAECYGEDSSELNATHLSAAINSMRLGQFAHSAAHFLALSEKGYEIEISEWRTALDAGYVFAKIGRPDLAVHHFRRFLNYFGFAGRSNFATIPFTVELLRIVRSTLVEMGDQESLQLFQHLVW